MIRVTLPWPHAALSPNSRIHHMVRARKAKSAKLSAWSLAYEAGVRRQETTPRTLTFTFHPPRRGMDLDNCIRTSFSCAKRGRPAREGVRHRGWY
jgi:crossover junction endodeoxyribonuclease RusA